MFYFKMRDDPSFQFISHSFHCTECFTQKSPHNKPLDCVSKIANLYLAVCKEEQEIRQMTSVWQLSGMILETQDLWMFSNFKTKNKSAIWII